MVIFFRPVFLIECLLTFKPKLMASRSENSLFLLLIFSILISCDPKDDPTPEPEPFPSLSIFKDRFAAEARARGINLDMSGLDMRYVEGKIVQNGLEFCGYGWSDFPSTGRRQVFISNSDACGFANYTDLRKELFVFHEIGHAFLNLKHDNSFLCDGAPVSIMHENVHMYGYYEEKPENKKYYLDELFDRLVAEEECIAYAKDFASDPVFFEYQEGDGNWIFSNAQGSFGGTRTINSLIISSIPNKTSSQTGYWFNEIHAPNIPKDAKVTLRTKVYSDGLTGPGAAIGLRVYETNLSTTGAEIIQSAFFTTENQPITGVLNGQVLELTYPKFTRKTRTIIPFAVMMPGTVGEVRFEDFEIIVEK